MKILLATGSDLLRLSLITRFDYKKYQMYGASDLIETLQVYKNNGPDLVIIDLELPRYGGLQAYRILKKFDVNAKIAFIGSGKNNEFENIIKEIDGDIEDYIVKPVDVIRLVKLFERVYRSNKQSKTA